MFMKFSLYFMSKLIFECLFYLNLYILLYNQLKCEEKINIADKINLFSSMLINLLFTKFPIQNFLYNY